MGIIYEGPVNIQLYLLLITVDWQGPPVVRTSGIFFFIYAIVRAAQEERPYHLRLAIL
jgi:hypothetical protein